MRVWIKTIIALAAALFTGLLIKDSWEWAVNFFDLFAGLSISIGRYIVFPLMFFSLTIRAFELHRQRKLGKTVGISWILMLVTSLIFSIIGTTTAFLFPRITSLPPQTQQALDIPGVESVIQQIFPENLFSIFTSDANFIIPLLVFALFLGWNLSFDKITTRPIAELFDSLSKTFSHMNIFFVEISGIGIYFISTNLIINIKSSSSSINIFSQLFLLLFIVTAVLLLIVYPLVIRIFAKQKNPFKILFGMMTPAIAALTSGNLFYSMPLTIQHNEKNLGIKNPINITASSMTLIAGRAGTALVTSAAAIFLRKYYVSIVEVYEIFAIIGLSFSLSFFLGSFHRESILAIIATIFTILQTKENEYINLVAIAPLLYCFSAFLDSVNNMVITYICGHIVLENRKTRIKEFI